MPRRIFLHIIAMLGDTGPKIENEVKKAIQDGNVGHPVSLFWGMRVILTSVTNQTSQRNQKDIAELPGLHLASELMSGVSPLWAALPVM